MMCLIALLIDPWLRWLSRTGTETLWNNQNSCFRLKTTGNTGIPVTTVRKKAGRIYSYCIFNQKVKVKVIGCSSSFLPDSCNRNAGISGSLQTETGISILAQSFGCSSAQPLPMSILVELKMVTNT